MLKPQLRWWSKRQCWYLKWLATSEIIRGEEHMSWESAMRRLDFLYQSGSILNI